MKTIYTLLTTVFAVAIITGCGGGGGGGSSAGGTTGSTEAGQNDDSGAGVIALSVGEKTPVQPGDKIVNASDDAVLDIVVVGNERSVTLRTGSAALARSSN